MQTLLSLPGERDDVCVLAVLAALERLTLGGCSAVVPGGLDQEPAGVTGAGLGDLALTATLPGAVLAGDQPDVAHQLPRALEALPVADLRAQPDRAERVHPA
jgi:hypothetical protein